MPLKTSKTPQTQQRAEHVQADQDVRTPRRGSTYWGAVRGSAATGMAPDRAASQPSIDPEEEHLIALFQQAADMMPKILDRAVQKIAARGLPKSSAYPIAVNALQKAGDLKRGTLKATAKGAKRGAMTAAQREATRK